MAIRTSPSRRSVLRMSLALAATGVAGCTSPGRPSAGPSSPGPSVTAPPSRTPAEAGGPSTLWGAAWSNGIVYGSSIATWQLDEDYPEVFDREAAILLPEDDLLWYRLRPRPEAELDFEYADRIVALAERNGQLLFGAHLVWDEGFGEGWTGRDEPWALSERRARGLLFGTVEETVARYRGRMAAWIVANEVTAPDGRRGLRTDVPWYATIGPGYVAEAYHIAREQDPDADLVLNEYGFETVNEFGDDPVARQRATLRVLDEMLDDGVPVDSLGVQAHLLADRFADRFDAAQYRGFLTEVTDRGLHLHVTELDVLDDGLPAAADVRDRQVADVYRRYLEVVLEERAVKTVISFGLTDRYTWLQEDYPREDGTPRRPLLYDDRLRPKPAYEAVLAALAQAPRRDPLWTPPRAR